MLDHGHTILFTVASAQRGGDRWDQGQIVTHTVGSAERKVVLRGGSAGRYVPTDHLAYMAGETLVVVPVDRTLRVRGGPVPIIDGVRRFSAGIGSPVASFGFSANGSLVYISAAAELTNPPRLLSIATRDGKLQPIALPPQSYRHPRISPDGTQLAVETDDGREAIIWVYDLRRGGPSRRLTFGGSNHYPVWTRDGRRITFQSDRDGDYGLFWQLADGTAPAERLAKPSSLGRDLPEAWSPDGKTLTFSEIPPFDSRVSALSLDRSPAQRPLSQDLPAQHSTFSPDGKWLAYASTEIGNRREIFVQPFPATGAKYQISTEGGTTPMWAPDQRSLYYWANLTRQFVAVDVRTEPVFSAGTKVALPIQAVFPSGLFPATNYDVMPDGKGFIVVASTGGDSRQPTRLPPQQIDVVLNWFEELKTRVPSK